MSEFHKGGSYPFNKNVIAKNIFVIEMLQRWYDYQKNLFDYKMPISTYYHDASVLIEGMD